MYKLYSNKKMQNYFSTGMRSFLTKGGGMVKNNAKIMGANMAEKQGTFGVFKGTFLNGGRLHNRPPP